MFSICFVPMENKNEYSTEELQNFQLLSVCVFTPPGETKIT